MRPEVLGFTGKKILGTRTFASCMRSNSRTSTLVLSVLITVPIESGSAYKAHTPC